MSLRKFYDDVIERMRITHERPGQAAFNHLVAVRPNLAEALRGTDSDPFYVDDFYNPKWCKFVEWLESTWTDV
jgi:hypothetical protein